MNDDRRKKIKDIIERLDKVYSELEDLATEEREAQENKPEHLQVLDAADSLDEAVSSTEDAKSSLESIE